MRKLITHMIKAALLLLVTMAFIQVHAQKRYAPIALNDVRYTIENDVQTATNVLEFDLYIKNNYASPDSILEVSSQQAGVLVTKAISLGTMTATFVPGTSEFPVPMQGTITYATGTPQGTIKCAAKAGPGCGSGQIVSRTAPGTRYFRVRLTSTTDFVVGSQANLYFSFTTVPYKTSVWQYYHPLPSPCAQTAIVCDATNCFPGTSYQNIHLNEGCTVVTTAATGVTTTTASLHGTIMANGTITTPVFEWGLNTGYGNSATGVLPVTVNGSVVTPITADQLTGLSPNTTYHYRLKGNYVTTYATNGTVNGLDMTFTTASPPPVVITNAASLINTNSAQLNGTVDPYGLSATVTIEYGTSTAYGTPVVPNLTTVNANSGVNVINGNTGAVLTPNTTYHYRLNATSTAGTTHGNDMTFSTDAVSAFPPIVTTEAATNIAPTTATVNGTVNANGAVTTVTFEYGLTTAYTLGPVPGIPSIVSGPTTQNVHADLSGLLPLTTYHYRCVGVNSAGTTYGIDMTINTPAITLPTVITNAATNATPTTATLNGTVTANGASTAVTFEYGLTLAYGIPVPGVPSPVLGNTATGVSANISGLLPNTCYHFRCVGVNSSGTAYGNDMTICTPCPPAGQAGPITGPTQVCQGGCGYVYTVTIPYATGYIWTLPVGGTITSGANTNSITVCYAANAVSGYVYVYGTSACGSGPPSFLGVAMNAPATPTITGPASACINSTGNVYTTQSGMTNYAWVVTGGTITAGGTTTSPTATVTWTSTGAKTISVNYNNANGCAGLAPFVYNVTVNALPVPVITGPSPACTNYPVVYSTDAGMTGYVWTVSAGGAITGGAGTNAINVTWSTTGSKTVSVNYVNANGCSAVTPVVKSVTVNSGAAPTITGLTDICVSSALISYTTQTGMTGYTWTIQGGIISFGGGTNSILVTWNTGGAQWVRVSYTNASGCSPYTPTQLNVTVTPIPEEAGEITGTSEICGGTTGVEYSVDPIADAETYVWTLPAGATIATGGGTNDITVDFANNASAGDITVYGNNVCGNGAVSPAFALSLSALPAGAGIITGPTGVCLPSTGVEYTVGEIAGAAGYVWTLPAGATITSGDNTNTITVDFSDIAVPGAITVYGTSSCGSGAVSPDLNITLTPVPAAPVITLDGYLLTSSNADGNQWYREGELIPGATDQTYDVATNNHTGIYWDVVIVNGCSSDTSNHIYVEIIGINELSSANFNIYPIPNDGRFTVSIVSPSQETYSITIYNNLGMKIFEAGNITVKGTVEKVIDLNPIAPGIYSVVLQNTKSHIEKKILINK